MITNITITIMMKNAAVDADMITTTTMIMNIIITIMMKNAVVDVDMIMIIITIIMQMRYLPAGARSLLESIQRKSLMKFLLSCLRRPSLVLS